MARSYVADLQKFDVDPQYPKAEFDRTKLTMQDKITRNMKVIMDLINDPNSLIRNRKDNDVEVLKVKHAILQDQLDSHSNQKCRSTKRGCSEDITYISLWW